MPRSGAMTSQVHRRQVLLFLAAILLPCVALVGLGVRLFLQERELAAVRLGDERRRITRQLRQELASHLQRTALRQAAALAVRPALLRARDYDDPAVALVARVSDGQLILPWEHDERPATSRRLLAQGAFGDQVRQADRAEFADAQPGRAVDLLRQAVTLAAHPVQVAGARLSLARVLARASREGEATAEYRTVITASPDIVDEHAIPLSLYAARQLVKRGVVDTSVLECLWRAFSDERWLSPPALYLLRDVVSAYLERAPENATRRTAADALRKISDELVRTERVLALKADLPGLGLVPVNRQPARLPDTWVLHGTPAWLVGVLPIVDGEAAGVVALRLGLALAALDAGAGRSGTFVGEIAPKTAADPDAEPLGAELPGLVVRFHRAADARGGDVGSIRSWSFAAAFCLVVGATLFGAYLLWRDVRREVRLTEMRSSFVSAVSHELKTPLTAIRMFAETLRANRPADAETQDEYLDTIVNESERLTRLLNNVLDFTKIEQGTKRYRRVRRGLGEIVGSAARAMKYPLEQQQFVLRTEIEENVPPARVDRDAIEQAILNLLANAMKYSGDSRDIELRLKSGNGTAVIEVSDRGIGIEPAEQGRIFERFYRVPGPDTDRIPGTGLGLTLVQHVAEAHGGHVEVKSAPGEGSTFSLVLPVESDDESAIRAETGRGGKSGGMEVR